MKTKAVILAAEDNVAVALMDLAAGTELDLKAGGQTVRIRLAESIPYQHKFSLKDTGSGGRIIKDSVVIGEATRNIKQGQHVHIHNMTGLRAKAMKG